MGLGFLPKDLQLWAKCKEKTKDCIDFRKYQKNMRVASSDPGMAT